MSVGLKDKMGEAFVMGEVRLGDVIDDYCIKCRRLTNHSIVSVVEAAAAKVRCRTCYHDHDYRFEQAPPTKKELKKMEEAAALAAAIADGTYVAPTDDAAAAAQIETAIVMDTIDPGITVPSAKSKTA